MNAKRVTIKPALSIDDDYFSPAKIIANELPTGKPKSLIVETKCSTLHPQARRFRVTIDTDNENLDKELAALLHLHSIGLPLLMSFNSLDTNYYKRYSPGIFGVFHCPRCLASWQRTNKLRSHCNEGARFIQGPKFPLSANDATKVLSLLQWSKKFAAWSLIQALPSLRQAFSDAEATRILKSLHRTKPASSNKDSSNFSAPGISALKRKRNRELVVKVAYYLRRYLFTAAPLARHPTNIKRPTNSFSDDSADRINLIGMRSDDGSFFPGFFSYKQFFVKQESNNVISKVRENRFSSKRQLLPDLPFVATGTFDNEGFYQSYNEDAAKLSDLDQLPSLHDVITSQTTKPVSDWFAGDKTGPGLDKESVVFCFQGGDELKLSEVFASGIWQTGSENEYFVAGVFDGHGHFKAAYCITEHGFLIPGTTNERRKFYPMCKYAENGNVSASFSSSELTDDLYNVFGQILNVLRFPHSSEFQRKDTMWKCVRNGTVSDDPACITVRSDGLFADSESLNIYVGGEINPESQLHLFGKYNDKGNFVPGAPPVLTDVEIQELTTDATPTTYVVEEFSRRFGIRLDKVASVMQSTTTLVLSDYKPLDENEERVRSRSRQDSDRRKAVCGELSQSIKIQLLRNKKLKDVKESVRKTTTSFAIRLPGMEELVESDEAEQRRPIVFGRYGSYTPPTPGFNTSVKNRTGKPPTKPGILIQAYFSTPYGESTVDKLEYESAERQQAGRGAANTYVLQKEYMENNRFPAENDYDAYTNRSLNVEKYTDIVKRGNIGEEIPKDTTTRKTSPIPREPPVLPKYSGRKSVEKENKSWFVRKSSAEAKNAGDNVKSVPSPLTLSRVQFRDEGSENMRRDSKKKKKRKKRNSEPTGGTGGPGGYGPNSSFPDHSGNGRRSSLQSAFLPSTFDMFSNLNFTKSYSFSYFEVPKYVKEHNKRIADGRLLMPTLEKKIDEDSQVDLVKAN